MYASSEHGSELLRVVLRYLAWAMLSMGIFTLLSGGVTIISSILVIACGYQWLCAAASRGSLQSHLDELALLRDRDCRGCCRNCCSGMCRGVFDNIRGLAIAAITIAVFELISYVTAFSLLGYIFTGYGYGYGYYGDFYTVRNTRQFGCYTSSSSTFCQIDYRPSYLSSYYPYSIPCYAGSTSTYCSVILPDTIYPSGYPSGYPSYYSSSYYNDLADIGRWLMYAVGNTAIAAPLNIMWGAITLQLVGALTIGTNGAGAAGESTALLSKGAVPVFMTAVAKPEPAF